MQQGPSSEQPKKQHTPLSKFLGASFGALGEQLLFHPVDTTAKTLMTQNQSAFPWLRSLVTERGLIGSAQKLYGGLSMAMFKKGPLRVYKYGVQDEMNAYMTRHYGEAAQTQFGSYGKVFIHCVAGALTGAIEPLFFHPIDTMQIRKQVLGEKLSWQNARALGITGLYRGAVFTGIGRNMGGSISLFGGSELANKLLDNDDHRSTPKNLFAKWVGAFVSLLASQPADVVKTRIQVQQIALRQAIAGTTLKEIFTSGLGPRLFMSFKVGVGFLFVEKGMDLAKNLFGKEAIEHDPIEIDRLIEEKPGILFQFESQKIHDSCSPPDAENTKDLEMEELTEKFKKSKI